MDCRLIYMQKLTLVLVQDDGFAVNMIVFLVIVSQNVLGGWTKMEMSWMEKARIGKGLGFNLCVAPCPMLHLYFGSGRLWSKRRNTKAEAENFGRT